MTHLGRSLRRTRVRERPARRAAVAAVVSLALNGLLFLLLVRAGAFEAPRPRKATQVAMAAIPSDRWAANRAITSDAEPRPRAPTAPRPAPAEKPPEDERDVKGQVVDVAPSGDSRRPDDARFLSDRDNTVEKETRSRFAGTQSWENTLEKPSTGNKAPPRAAGEGGRSSRNTPGAERTKGPRGTGADRLTVPDQPGQERLALAPGGDAPAGVRVPDRRDLDRVPGSGRTLAVPGPLEPEGGGERRAGAPDPLLPSVDSMQRILGGPSPDHVEGVEEGDGTALNTRSFKYATFINRVGRSIWEEWRIGVVRAYDARDPDRQVFPIQDRETWIEVELDPSGNLVQAKVLDGSGLEFLDREVTRAARAAAPFPNPPAGLADADGRIRLALGYVLRVNAPPRIIFRRNGY